MSELEPCPFCGGEADVHHFAHDDSECTVMCSNPNCRASVSARSCGSMTTAYNRARKLWNRRAERTCRMGAPIDGEYRCGECGHLNRETYRADKGWHPPEYCAHCGAKAVDE